MANADDVAVAIVVLQIADELLDVVHIVVQVELTFTQRHQTRIAPVGDVDLVLFEHGFDGIAQQRGVVTRERSNDQNNRLAFDLGERLGVVGKTFETAQFAKRLVHLDAFVDSDFYAIDIDGFDTELWLHVIFAQAVDQVVSSRYALTQRRLAKRRHGIAVELGSGLRKISKRLHQGALGFKNFIKHARVLSKRCPCNITVQYELKLGAVPQFTERLWRSTRKRGRYSCCSKPPHTFVLCRCHTHQTHYADAPFGLWSGLNN